MHIDIQRTDDAFRLEAHDADGHQLRMDGSLDIGGHNDGFRPMQLLLVALGGCSAIDVISILRKQPHPIEDLRIRVSGEREPGVVPALFREIHVHFHLKGAFSTAQAERAVRLSMEKYCSVAQTLAPTAHITHDLTHEP